MQHSLERCLVLTVDGTAAAESCPSCPEVSLTWHWVTSILLVPPLLATGATNKRPGTEPSLNAPSTLYLALTSAMEA